MVFEGLEALSVFSRSKLKSATLIPRELLTIEEREEALGIDLCWRGIGVFNKEDSTRKPAREGLTTVQLRTSERIK